VAALRSITIGIDVEFWRLHRCRFITKPQFLRAVLFQEPRASMNIGMVMIRKAIGVKEKFTLKCIPGNPDQGLPMIFANIVNGQYTLGFGDMDWTQEGVAQPCQIRRRKPKKEVQSRDIRSQPIVLFKTCYSNPLKVEAKKKKRMILATLEKRNIPSHSWKLAGFTNWKARVNITMKAEKKQMTLSVHCDELSLSGSYRTTNNCTWPTPPAKKSKTWLQGKTDKLRRRRPANSSVNMEWVSKITKTKIHLQASPVFWQGEDDEADGKEPKDDEVQKNESLEFKDGVLRIIPYGYSKSSVPQDLRFPIIRGNLQTPGLKLKFQTDLQIWVELLPPRLSFDDGDRLAKITKEFDEKPSLGGEVIHLDESISEKNELPLEDEDDVGIESEEDGEELCPDSAEEDKKELMIDLSSNSVEDVSEIAPYRNSPGNRVLRSDRETQRDERPVRVRDEKPMRRRGSKGQIRSTALEEDFNPRNWYGLSKVRVEPVERIQYKRPRSEPRSEDFNPRKWYGLDEDEDDESELSIMNTPKRGIGYLESQRIQKGDGNRRRVHFAEIPAVRDNREESYNRHWNNRRSRPLGSSPPLDDSSEAEETTSNPKEWNSSYCSRKREKEEKTSYGQGIESPSSSSPPEEQGLLKGTCIPYLKIGSDWRSLPDHISKVYSRLLHPPIFCVFLGEEPVIVVAKPEAITAVYEVTERKVACSEKDDPLNRIYGLFGKLLTRSLGSEQTKEIFSKMVCQKPEFSTWCKVIKHSLRRWGESRIVINGRECPVLKLSHEIVLRMIFGSVDKEDLKEFSKAYFMLCRVHQHWMRGGQQEEDEKRLQNKQRYIRRITWDIWEKYSSTCIFGRARYEAARKANEDGKVEWKFWKDIQGTPTSPFGEKSEFSKSVVDENKQEEGVQQKTQIGNIEDLFGVLVAGIESLGTLFQWITIFLAADDKVRCQIANEVKRGKFEFDTLFSLQYCKQVVCEVLRARPTVACVARVSKNQSEVEIAGKRYTIPGRTRRRPEGTTVIVANHIISHNSDIWWENPKGFNPDRFHAVSIQDRETKWPNGVAFRPFGDIINGQCPAYEPALFLGYLYTALVASHCELHIVKSTSPMDFIYRSNSAKLRSEVNVQVLSLPSKREK